MKILKLVLISGIVFGSVQAQEANIYLDLGIKKFVGKESTLQYHKYFGIQTDINDSEFLSSNSLFPNQTGIKPTHTILKNISSLSGSFSSNQAKNNSIVAKLQGIDLDSNPISTPIANRVSSYFNKITASQKVLIDIQDEIKNPLAINNASKYSLFYKNLGTKLDELNSPVLLSSPLLETHTIDEDNFDLFKNTLKTFIEISGKEIDQYTTDITDGVDIKTQSIAYRSGANVEATFDLINTLNFSKHNKVKPFLINHYGLKFDNWLNQAHSNYNDALIIESLNNQVMSLLDKPDNIVKAIPNIYANAKATPNPYTLVTKQDDGSFGKTDLIKFYDFWKDIAGDRTYITSDNPDVQVNAFKNKGKWINVFNNLSDKTQTLHLKFSHYDTDRISKYTLRRIYTNAEGVTEITEAHTDIHIDQLDIEPFETFMLILDVPADTEFATSIVEYNNYSKSYLKPITANEIISFNIENTVIGKGRANIRLSFGRNKKLSRYPIVKLNDNVVLTPTNWPGYDQENKENFFGTLIIPVPLSYVKASNKIDISFPDTGGHVSSVVINTEIFSNDVENKNYIEKNAPVFVSHGGILLNVSKKLHCTAPRILDKKGNTIKKIKGYHAGNTVDISTLKSGEYIFKLKSGSEYPFKK